MKHPTCRLIHTHPLSLSLSFSPLNCPVLYTFFRLNKFRLWLRRQTTNKRKKEKNIHNNRKREKTWKTKKKPIKSWIILLLDRALSFLPQSWGGLSKKTTRRRTKTRTEIETDNREVLKLKKNRNRDRDRDQDNGKTNLYVEL